MTARKHRTYIVEINGVEHLSEATTSGQATQAVTRDTIRVRVAEPADILRIARAAGADIRVARPAEVDPSAPKRGPGRPPRAAYATAESVLQTAQAA
jgi:hypothetical protein